MSALLLSPFCSPANVLTFIARWLLRSSGMLDTPVSGCVGRKLSNAAHLGRVVRDAELVSDQGRHLGLGLYIPGEVQGALALGQ